MAPIFFFFFCSCRILTSSCVLLGVESVPWMFTFTGPFRIFFLPLYHFLRLQLQLRTRRRCQVGLRNSVPDCLQDWGGEFIICSICVLSPVVKTFFGSIFQLHVAVFRGAGEGSTADVFLWHGRSCDCWLSMNVFIPQPIPQVPWEAQPAGGGRGGGGGGHFDTECASRGSV